MLSVAGLLILQENYFCRCFGSGDLRFYRRYVDDFGFISCIGVKVLFFQLGSPLYGIMSCALIPFFHDL